MKSAFSPILRRRRTLVGAFSVGFALLAGCRQATPPAPTPGPKVTGDTVIYAVDAPQRSALIAAPVQPQARAVLHFTGRVVWDEDATVRIYSPVLGRVRSVQAKLGETVAADALLARIDSPDLGQALADARKAESGFALAEHTLARVRELFAHGAIARKDVEGAEDLLTSAAAERQRARTKLALYGATPGSTNETYPLRTPIGGVIVEKNLNPGQEVRPDAMLANLPQLTSAQFVVTNPLRLWVLLDASELDLAMLRPDQALRLTTRAYPDRIFTGRITTVGASLDPITRTLKVRGYVDNPDQLLKAEMYVDAEAELGGTPGSVSVAAQAVFLTNNQAYVYIETAPGRYTRRAVSTGAEAGGRIVVQKGLAPDDHVITEGALLLETVRAGGGPS